MTVAKFLGALLSVFGGTLTFRLLFGVWVPKGAPPLIAFWVAFFGCVLVMLNGTQIMVIRQGELKYEGMVKVAFRTPFAVSVSPTTDREWAAFQGSWKQYLPMAEPLHMGPMVEARAYARWLSNKTGQTYRLPSESEWDYIISNNVHIKHIDRYVLHEDCWHASLENRPKDGSAWVTDCELPRFEDERYQRVITLAPESYATITGRSIISLDVREYKNQFSRQPRVFGNTPDVYLRVVRELAQ